MSARSQYAAGVWLEMEAKLLKRWGKLTKSDLAVTKGNIGILLGVLEQKLALTRKEAQKALHEIEMKINQATKRKAA